MAIFVSKTPVRVEVDERPGEWIEIKPKMSVGDRGRLTDAIMRVSQGGGGEAAIDMKAGQYIGAMLEAGIVNWLLLDEGGQTVPFKRELIAELDPDDPLVDKALLEITQRNPGLGGRAQGPGSMKPG
jgi:hypothetical protein